MNDTRVRFIARYRPTGPVQRASVGSLAHFLTERYCLYTADASGRGYRLEIHHEPWPLQPAEVEFEVNSVAQPQGIGLPDVELVAHFSDRLDVVGWGLEPLW